MTVAEMPEMKDVLIRGLRVRCAAIGEGPPLVLIHGFLVSHKCWLPMLPYLTKHFRCVILDLPGFGGSEKRGPGGYPYTREAFAETVADVMSALGVTRAHICGHSMGGSIALTLAADKPELVEKLCVIDSACFPFEVPVKGRIPLIPVIGPFVFKHLYKRPLIHDYFKHDVWSDHPGIDLKAVDEYYDDLNPPDAREAAYAALLSTVDIAPLGPKISRIKKETLVIWGDEDRIFPLATGQRLVREIPGARLQIVEKSGHAPAEEHPAKTADLIKTFLSA